MSAAADAIIRSFRRQVFILPARVTALPQSGDDRAIGTGQLTGQYFRANEEHEEHRSEAKRFGPERHALV